jgi:hypothetical protein
MSLTPSDHSNSTSLFILNFLTNGSALPFWDMASLLHAEVSRANSWVDSVTAHRDGIQQLLITLEPQVAESLPLGSRSSRVERTMPKPKGKGKGKAKSEYESQDESTLYDKGKGRAEPQDKDDDEDSAPPSCDGHDFKE